MRNLIARFAAWIRYKRWLASSFRPIMGAANQIPLTGGTSAAGGYTLPIDQGGIITQGILQQAGAIQLAGDARSTRFRKETFSIWKGLPTASFVGEAGTKPTTGAEFGAGTLNVKKVATIVEFTDEMLDDIQGGDLNVLVDTGIRKAIADTIDSDAIKGSNFDNHLKDTTSTVAADSTKQDWLATAVSAAMGSLESAGYNDLAVLLPYDLNRHLRDARQTMVSGGGTAPTQSAIAAGLYNPIGDPLYGLDRFTSTNLDSLSGTGTIGYVVSRPNLHVRIRQDVTVLPTREATVGGVSMYETDMSAARYVTRLAFGIHDLNRAVVKLTK